MKREFFSTVFVLLLALITGVAAHFIFSGEISSDTWLQYAGTTIGGLATMLGVLLTIGEERRHRETENRPQIRLTLSDYYYRDPHHKFYSYFRGTFDTENKGYISTPDNVVPLRIENFGKSDVLITEIELIRGSQALTYNHKDGTPASFSIYSQEFIDIPFRVHFDDDKTPFHVELSYRSESAKATFQKRYHVYIPRDTVQGEEAYREWVRRINIEKAPPAKTAAETDSNSKE